MKERKKSRSISPYVTLFLLAILFAQYSLICMNASAAPIPEQAEASIIIQSDDPASLENHCATETGCAHTCHFTMMSTPEQEDGALPLEFQQTCRESISPLTATRAVFHPPRLS